MGHRAKGVHEIDQAKMHLDEAIALLDGAELWIAAAQAQHARETILDWLHEHAEPTGSTRH